MYASNIFGPESDKFGLANVSWLTGKAAWMYIAVTQHMLGISRDGTDLKSTHRIYYIMQTICACGIRVSELRFITVEALKKGVAYISNKGKNRRVYIPDTLSKLLQPYILMKKIKSGSIFVTRTGKPIDRSNIWAEMKKLCKRAGVLASKVFPHNLRHLFARTYYKMHQDVVRLADIAVMNTFYWIN